MSDPMNKTEAVEWLKLQLGGGVVVIELLEEHFDTAFSDALRWYAGRKGIQRKAVVNLTPSIMDYTMPDDCDVVFNVIFPGVALNLGGAGGAGDPFSFVGVDQAAAMNNLPRGQFQSTLKLLMQSSETGRRIIGSEPAWEYDKGTNAVHVYPNSQRTGVMVAEYLSTLVTVDDPVPPAAYPVNDFRRRMTFRDRDIILRYAHAKTKWMLSRVRGKYTDGMPSSGGSKNLDGDTLLGEAQGEIEALNEEIKALSEPVAFITG